jgi:hypothetical protein
MKSFHGFFELIAALILIICLSGCASATLQIEKEVPAPPTQPISLILGAAEGVQLSAEDMNNLRAMIVDSLAWEGGLRVGSNNQFKVIGTVTRYDPGVRFLRPFFGPGYFDSTWVVLDEHDGEIGKARINGSIYAGKYGGSYDKVLEKVGERLSEFLTKKHEAPRPTK